VIKGKIAGVERELAATKQALEVFLLRLLLTSLSCNTNILLGMLFFFFFFPSFYTSNLFFGKDL
jgi:hypothetical protein